MDIQTSKEYTEKLPISKYCLAISAMILSYPLNFLSPNIIEKILNIISHDKSNSSFESGLQARIMICSISPKAKNYDGCIKRSLGMYMILWLQGKHCSWCTGYIMDPFRSHAWIEINSKPVGEPSDISHYKKVIETN